MALKTRLGEILRPLSLDYGKNYIRMGNNSCNGAIHGTIPSIFINYSSNL